MYKIAFREKALKEITKKLSPKDRKKVLSKIERLASNPFSKTLDIKKLVFFPNLEKTYRLRVGNLRVIYELDIKNKTIIIYKVDYRRTTTYS